MLQVFQMKLKADKTKIKTTMQHSIKKKLKDLKTFDKALTEY